MRDARIAFIGGGNMASALIGGLVGHGCDPNRIITSDPDPARREALAARFGVATCDDNLTAVADADVVVFAVKPQVLREVVLPLGEAIRQRQPLLLSIAAGIREASIERWLGGPVPLVRSMPNTPALIGAGASALHANAATGKAQRELAESILRAVGVALWVEQEADLDAVTALSGSGPAYFFKIMEALETAGTGLGLSSKTAHLLTLQTALGAARMALESPDSPAELRRKVTSPGGTTERALETLTEGDLDGLLTRAVTAARARAEELSRILGRDDG